MNKIENNIDVAIKSIISDFKKYPDKYLTESDVRCCLVGELVRIPEFNQLQDTEDGSKSIPIHTEVRWYGQSGKLKWRSDIVILDVKNLRVKSHDLFKLPSKGFGFNQPRAIIEIKLRRINGESNSTFIVKVNRDIEKLRCIRREVWGNYFCGLVVLDKKSNVAQEMPSIEDSPKVYYQAVKAIRTVSL